MVDAKGSPDRGVASNGLSSAWFRFDEETASSSEGTPDRVVGSNVPELCPNDHPKETHLRTSPGPDQGAPASIEQPRPPQTRSAIKAVFQTPTNDMETKVNTQADQPPVAIPVGNEARPFAEAPMAIQLLAPKSPFTKGSEKTWIIVATAIVTAAALGVLFIVAAILGTGKQPAESGGKSEGSVLVPLQKLNQDPARFEGKTVVIRAQVSGKVVEKPKKWLWLTVKGKEVTVEGSQVNKAGINFVIAKEDKERLLTGLRDGDFNRATITATIKNGRPGWLAVVSDIKLDQEAPVKPKKLGGP